MKLNFKHNFGRLQGNIFYIGLYDFSERTAQPMNFYMPVMGTWLYGEIMSI